MRTSTRGIELIKHFESLHDGDLSEIGLQPKMCPAGIWTEGYGHAIVDPATGKLICGQENEKRARYLSYISDPDVDDYIEAEILLQKDLQKFEKIVLIRCTASLTQNQFDALVSHTFNTGGSSTLFRLINEGRDCRQWWTTKYITSNGIKLKGLVRRRKAEYELFVS